MFFCNALIDLLAEIMNDTREARGIRILYYAHGLGREATAPFILPPNTTIPIFDTQNIQEAVGVVVFVSNPTIDTPDQFCRLLAPLGTRIKVSSIVSADECFPRDVEYLYT